MSRRITQIILVAGALVLVYFLLVNIKVLPSFRNIFRPSVVLIDDTPVLIREIKSISELVTVTAYDEVVVSAVKPSPTGSVKQLIQLLQPAPVVASDRLVLVVKGQVMAGCDLSQLSENAIFLQDDSVSIQLPASRILEIIVNPSGTETFIEDGEWSQVEVNAVKLRAKELLQRRAMDKVILAKADAQALRVMHGFLSAAGFRRIRVTIAR